MIRISRHITTGKILCSQGGALPDEATMKANALSAFPDIPEAEIEVVDLTEGEFAAAMAEQNAPTLEQAKAAKLAAIQAEKSRARDAGFLVGGVLFDSDAGARLAYLELENALAADASYATGWKASAGVWVTMDAALYSQVKAAGTAHIAACFAWQAAKEAEVAAALTVAAVNAVSSVWSVS